MNIKTETKRLNKIFSNIPKDKLDIVKHLIENCSFMADMLCKLQDEILLTGVTATSNNMVKESPALKSYNALIKNYQSTIKQLLDLLPKEIQEEHKDELLEFLKK